MLEFMNQDITNWTTATNGYNKKTQNKEIELMN